MGEETEGEGVSGGVVAQLEAILAGIEERTEHSSDCSFTFREETAGAPRCNCGRAVRVRCQVARTVERMLAAAIERASFFGRPDEAPWAAALQAARPEQEQR